MSFGLFLQIVLLIIIAAFVMNIVKCLHDKFCVLCKKKDECCK